LIFRGPASVFIANSKCSVCKQCAATNNVPLQHFFIKVIVLIIVLRATAVPAGTAERVLAMVILSVCPSVCHDPVPIQSQVR